MSFVTHSLWARPRLGFFGRSSSAARPGVTLVELLMVTAILGLLMALTFSAYFSVMRRYGSRGGSGDGVAVDPMAVAMSAVSETPLQIQADPYIPPPGDDYVPDEYIVGFNPTVTNLQEAAENLAAAYPGGKVLHVYNRFQSCGVYIPGVTVDQLQGNANVRYVERNGRGHSAGDAVPTGIMRMSSPGRNRLLTIDPTQFGLPNVRGYVAVANTHVVVAVPDSGIDQTHPDLNVTRRFSFVTGDPSVDLASPHGTHLAGIIGAKINNVGVVGEFPGVELWSLRIKDSSNNYTNADLISALTYVLAHASEITVCNLSLGGAKSNAVNDAVNACATAGVFMCVAAGNSSVDASTKSPASAAEAVSVAALVDTDGKPGGLGPLSVRDDGGQPGGKTDDTFASFSNFGATVTVIAPGVNILSDAPGGGYRVNSGTSMATAHMSGLLAYFSGSTITYSSSRTITTPARPSGRELVALLLRNRGGELIPGPGGRSYPLLFRR